MIRPATTAFALLLLAGCAGETRHYPSLAPRAVEKQSFAEPVVAAAVAKPDAVLDTRIVAQSVELGRITAGFTAAAETARHSATAAAHQPVGSEAWLNAQAALARVDDWRAQGSALASEIEAAGSARAGQLLPPYPALNTLRDQAAAETEREARMGEALQAMVQAA